MAGAPNPAESGTAPEVAPPARLWTGTGLCSEAQGDGVPCRDTDGECETCERAIPLPEAAEDRP